MQGQEIIRTHAERKRVPPALPLFFFCLFNPYSVPFAPPVSASLSGVCFFAINLWLRQVHRSLFLLGKMVHISSISPQKVTFEMWNSVPLPSKAHFFVQSTKKFCLTQFISRGPALRWGLVRSPWCRGENVIKGIRIRLTLNHTARWSLNWNLRTNAYSRLNPQ